MDDVIIIVFVIAIILIVMLAIENVYSMYEYSKDKENCEQIHNVYACEQIIEWKPIYSTESK